MTPVPPDLRARILQPELMDAPELPRDRHARALDGLSRINALSLTAGRIWAQVRRLTPPVSGPLRILDVACGGGDVVLALKRHGEKEDLRVEVSGCDRSPVALEYARARAAKQGLEVEFFQHDALRESLPPGFHFICSSLFLHHLSEDEAVAFLGRLKDYGARLCVQDLLRTRMGYALAWITVRTVTRSPVVRVDGIRSVLAAYSLHEVESLARKAGLRGARIRRCWPQRFSLAWEAA